MKKDFNLLFMFSVERVVAPLSSQSILNGEDETEDDGHSHEAAEDDEDVEEPAALVAAV